MKSVWETLSKMTPDDREKHMNLAKNRQKKTKTGTKSAIYTKVEIIAPADGLQWLGGPGWDED